MTTRDPAPSGLRRLATLATLATTVLALAGLPASELPLAWLLAFTLPGAVLGGWSRLTQSPWRRALLAVTLQAGACWAALELVGPMTRPAALACTILPPLAFATTRNHDGDPSLALFLSLCVTLVGVILDGLHLPLLLGYVTAAFLSLHVATLLRSYRGSAPGGAPPKLRALDVNATSLLLTSCLLAMFAVDRTLTCLPSPSRSDDGLTKLYDPRGERKEMGLDDTFAFDNVEGVLSELQGEQLVRAESADGQLPATMYLRCGFFAVPDIDRWGIGKLNLQLQSEPDGHVFRRPDRRRPVRTVGIERYAGAAKFVFVPPYTTSLRGLEGLAVDPTREWIRPRTPDDSDYEVSWQEPATAPRNADLDLRAANLGLLTLPVQLDQRPFRKLLSEWQVRPEPLDAMADIAAGLARRCRYSRSTPTGPFAHELENFLFAEGDRHGYCMHFASAAALLLRMQGVPCRIGVGLYGGQATSDGPDVRIYGSQHAHAWVEVPFADRGFVVFDPTPANARGRGFVPDDRPAADSDPDVVLERPFYEPAVRAVTTIVTTPWTWSIALALALLLAVLPRRAPRRVQATRVDVTPKARRALQRLLRALARSGLRRVPGQTLERFAAEIDRRGRLDPAVAAAFTAYQEVRFGGRSFDEAHALALEQGVRAAAAMANDQPAAGQQNPTAS